jgi:uncharacterized RDD family membrane protein YckC
VTGRRFFILLAILLAVAAGPIAAQPVGAQPVAAGSSVLLAGNDSAVWLVQPSADGRSFDIFVRKIGKNFKPVVRELTGRPVQAVAVGEKLHLLFQRRQYTIIGADGAMFNAQDVPGEVLCACQAVDFGDSAGPSLLAIVNSDTDPQAGQAATQPIGAKTKPKGKPIGFGCIYQSVGGRWELILSEPASRDKNVSFCAVVGKRLYKLDISPASAGLSLEISRFGPGKGEAGLGWVGIAADTRLKFSPRSMAMLGAAGKLVVADSAPADKSAGPGRQLVRLRLYDSKANELSKPQPIRRDGKAMTWPVKAPPHITRLGSQLALLWTEGDKQLFALVNPATAEMQPSENLTEALAAVPDKEKLLKIREYFFWAVLILMGLSMFALRPRTPPKPFTLPEGMRTGNLLKRLVALMIDFLPCNAVGAAIFMPPMQPADLKRIFENPETAVPTAELLYAWILSISLFAVYCTIMELKFGATLGKMAMKLRVVADEGAKPRLREIALRNLLKIVELSMLQTPHAVWFLGILIILPIITRNRQRLGDMIARTAVIDARILLVPPVQTEPSELPTDQTTEPTQTDETNPDTGETKEPPPEE